MVITCKNHISFHTLLAKNSCASPSVQASFMNLS